MKITISFSSLDKAALHDPILFDTDSYGESINTLDNVLEAIMAEGEKQTPPSTVTPQPLKGPYSPSNPAHPKEEK